MIKDKYIVVDPYTMNQFYKEGYRFLFIYEDKYDSMTTELASGQFMDNPITLNMPVTRSTINTKVVMELTKQAEILYGEKHENIT